MSIKLKKILYSPLIMFFNWRSRRIAKKIKKTEGEERYPMQWRNDYVLKRAKFFLKIYKVKIEVKGFEKIPKAPVVIVPNYNSIFDPIIIFAALENPEEGVEDTNYMPIFLANKKCINKKKIKGYMSILDTHFVDNNVEESLKNVEKMNKISKLNKKYQVIFAKKNYSDNKKTNEFKNLAFKNAKKFFLPIVPVTINNSLNVENVSRNSFQKVEVIFHSQIKPMNIISQPINDIANKIEKIIQSKLKNMENGKTKK